MTTKWKFNDDEKSMAAQVLEKFIDDKQRLQYDQIQQSPEWQKLVVEPNRNILQFKQAMSHFRKEIGKGLPRVGGRQKKASNFIKRKYTRRIPVNINKEDISSKLPKLGIEPEFKMRVCPNCLCNLEAGLVGINIPINKK